ncbi:hypothetical protein [Candidatus Nitrosocosmicus franklandus]|uniref:Uncharacterized protein n=1 Tax=Candidatus Nitrosocosmicus franklandianus TaxID=1798806 RepID=A0A484IFN4_9ARCH|nr:hypothetical protein [Candidatus Nitrosocosmicus franklandus]VFJ14821.1 conserved exported protein of unknown function [Candidatus Nitrosocosmicus franklandus]
MNTKTVLSLLVIATFTMGFNLFEFSNTNAQNNITALPLSNSTSNSSNEEKSYILIFEQRNIGNIDNSTKIVSSIIGHDIVKIADEFVEEISLAPSQQLEQQIEDIIYNGTNGLPCNASLTTQEGKSVSVECISSENIVIWYVHT